MIKNLRFIALYTSLLLLIISGTIAGQNSGYVSNIAFAPETGIVALGLIDVVELRHIEDNELIATVASALPANEIRSDSDFHITELAFNPAGTQLAIGYSGYHTSNYVLVVNVLSGQIIYSFAGEGGVFSLAWHPNGNQLAAKIQYGYGNPTLRRLLVWDITNGAEIATLLLGFESSLFGLDWHSDGSQIVSAYIGNTVAIWDVSSWTRSDLILETDNIVLDAVWNMDESKIIAVDYERTLYVWDSTTGELLQKLENGLREGNYQFAVSPTDKVAINGGLNIVIWDLSDEPKQYLIPVTQGVSDIVWSNDAELLYADSDGYHTYNVDDFITNTPQPR
jgi:WD40 repeat protein